MNRILILEDEAVIRRALRRLLEHEGYRIEEAACIAIRIRQLTIAAHARDDGPVSGPDEARPESHDRMRALRRARSTLTAQ